MKQGVKGLSLLTTALAIFSFLLLGGCVASKQDASKEAMMMQDVKPLTADQVKALFSNATETHTTPRFDAITYYSADGKVKSTAKFKSGNEESDEGVWRVDNSGSLCGKFLGKWSKGGEKCFAVYPEEEIGEYTLVTTSGTPPKTWRDGKMKVMVKAGM